MAATTPLPTNLKVLRGTAQPCRLNDKEPKPPPADISMPDGLSQKEQQHWQQVAGYLQEAGVLTVMDVQALKLYCRIYVKWQESIYKLDEYGPVIKTKAGNPSLSPYFKISQKYLDQLLAILREFGMTPSSRTKIHASSDKPDDDYEAWQKKRRMAREGV